MPRRYKDCTRPEDDPANEAARRETAEIRRKLEDELERAHADLSHALNATLERLRVDHPMAFDVFMKRLYEGERTKERMPKQKSFRKIAEEVGLAGKDTDERHAERQARRLYREANAYIEVPLKNFQEKYVELKRKLRELTSD